MLVQALAAFSDTRLQAQLNDVAFEERALPYFLQIDFEGRFIGVQERFVAATSRGSDTGGSTRKLRAMSYRVPRSPVTLTKGIFALLGIGELKYVLGTGAWTKQLDTARDEERRGAFVQRLRDAHAATNDRALSACICFYEEHNELQKARDAMEGALPGSYVALVVAGKVLTDFADVERWWCGFYNSESLKRASAVSECLISGIVGPIPATHPQIRHTANIGGKAGVALMSFNAPSFRSYGWAQNANAPVSVDRALAYTMALNEMLKPGSPYRHDEGEVAFLCWLQRPAPLYPTLMVNEAPPQSRIREVKKILALEHDPALKGNLFHMLALSANGGRLIVRSSLIEELDTVAANVVSWWEGLQIRPLRRNKPISVPRLWQLKLALDRKGDPPNNRTTALWNRALGGASRPLGYQIIGDVINRMRADKTKRLDPAAIGLLRLSLNDIFYGNGKGELIPVALEKTNANEKPAYVCGRLLALHDDLQYITFDLAGESQPPFTVADRFYALVMNSPAIGIGKVFDLGRKHLRMLRRLSRLMPDVRHGGAQIAFDYEQAIGDLEKMLNGEPPVRFGMHDKARFALGFYHQKGLRWRHDVRPDGESLGGREEASEEEKVVEL